MKSPITALTWIAIPVAAAAGFLASRHHSQSNAARHLNISARTLDSAFSPTGKAKAEGTGVVARWTDRLTKATAADLPALHAEIQQLPDKQDVHRALLLLCARWVELDAPGGLAYFSALEDKNQKVDGRMMLLTEWATLDPLAVYAAITRQPEKEAEADITNVGHALLGTDPDKFWIWFQHARKPLPWSWGVDKNWQHLASGHFDELSGIATGLLEEETNAGPENAPARHSKLEGLYATLASALAEKDPDKAMEWAKQLPEAVRNRALTGALEVLVKKSPERITEFLALLKNKQTGGNSYQGSGADQLVEKAVGSIIKKDTLKALDWLRTNFEKLGDHPYEVCRQFGQGLAADMRNGKMTPEQAFAAVRAAREYDGAIRSGVLTSMWEGLPPEQLTTIESRDAAKLALQGIFPQWVKQDSTAALAFAAALPDRNQAAQLYENLARSSSAGLVSSQGERMASTLKLIPLEYRAERVADQVGMRWVGDMMDHSGPFDGASFSSALEGLPPGPATDKAFTQVAAAWGASEPEAALTWATGQSDSALRKTATGAAVEAWAKEDAWGTSQWIDALPPGETRDTASHHLARSLRKEEPVSAWTWAGSIGDPAVRLEAQAAVLREWRNTTTEDAAAAVQSLADRLPAADYQKLADSLTPPAKAQ